MDLRDMAVSIAEMNTENVRLLVIISATVIFVLGLYLAKDYVAAQFEESDRKVKISFRMMLGFILMVSAVVFVALAPEIYNRILLSV